MTNSVPESNSRPYYTMFSPGRKTAATRIKQICYSILILFSISALASASFAQNCPKRVATIEESHVSTGVTLKDPQMAWMRKPMLAIDEMTRNNPYFTGIPDARLRNYMFAGIYGETKTNEKITGDINIVAYSRKGWDDKCGIIPQADRIAAGEGFIGFGLNHVDREMLGSPELCPYHDDQLSAFYEPQPAGNLAGHTCYNVGYLNLILLTYNGKRPWIPVTVREYLDFAERKMNRDIAEFRAQQKQNASRQFDEAATTRMYEQMKKTDPQKAEAYLQTTKAMKKSMEENAIRAQNDAATYDAERQKEVSDLRAFRAALTTAQLQQQAVTGTGKYRLCLSEPCDNKNKLVKLDPDFIPYVKDRRIKIIGIRYIKVSKQPGWADLVRQTVESLDYKTLQELMK